MAVSPKRQIGDKGEKVACKYLENNSYFVHERNYWKPWGEIDIVAEKDGVLHFVEVKTVSRDLATLNISHETFRPEDNVHPAKLKKLYRAIQTYLIQRKVPETKQWQIDVACVFLDFSTKKARIELLDNVIL